MIPVASRAIEGRVSSGFEPVRDAFEQNFARRHELGGACCVYHRGKKVVDLWGGVRNKTTGEPWERDTMVVVHSATKGLAAMTLAIAHSRGWLDYDERVATYWPEFAQQGKERNGNGGDDRLADADVAPDEQHGCDEKKGVAIQAGYRAASSVTIVGTHCRSRADSVYTPCPLAGPRKKRVSWAAYLEIDAGCRWRTNVP